MPVNVDLVNILVNFLNEMLAHDRKAVTELAFHRVDCGKALATHDTVQVLMVKDDITQSVSYKVGMLGLLNGLCGSYDSGPKARWGALIAEMDENSGLITRFRRMENVEDEK